MCALEHRRDAVVQAIFVDAGLGIALAKQADRFFNELSIEAEKRREHGAKRRSDERRQDLIGRTWSAKFSERVFRTGEDAGT